MRGNYSTWQPTLDRIAIALLPKLPSNQMQIEPWQFLSKVITSNLLSLSSTGRNLSNYQLEASGTFANCCVHFHCMSRGDIVNHQWLTSITYLHIAAHGSSQHSDLTAPPFQGVWGFIAGGLCWFAIPFGLATTMGLAYLGLSSAQGAPMLTDEDVMKGEEDDNDDVGGELGGRSLHNNDSCQVFRNANTGLRRKLSLEFLSTQSCTPLLGTG